MTIIIAAVLVVVGLVCTIIGKAVLGFVFAAVAAVLMILGSFLKGL